MKLIHTSTSVLVSCWFWSSVAEPLLAHRADEKLLLSPLCRTGLGLQWGFPFSYLVTLGFSLVAMHGGPDLWAAVSSQLSHSGPLTLGKRTKDPASVSKPSTKACIRAAQSVFRCGLLLPRLFCWMTDVFFLSFNPHNWVRWVL